MHATLPDHVMTLHPKPSPRTKSQPFFLFLTPESPAVMLEAPFLFVNEILLTISAPQKKRNFPRPHQIKLRRDWVMTPPRKNGTRESSKKGFLSGLKPFFPFGKEKEEKKKRKKQANGGTLTCMKAASLAAAQHQAPPPSSLTPFKRSHL